MPEPLRLRLFENYRFVLYAPFYAAHAIGAYAEEGLAVELLPSPGPGRAEAALAAGEVDVIWMGPIRVMKHHDDSPASPLAAFAEVVCRDPFSLIGARPNPGFRLAELAGLRFASVSEVPTPWLCLQEDLRRTGLDPDALSRVADRTMAENVAALRRGEFDVVQIFQPFVEDLIAAGDGHIWYAAATRGPTAYTSFYTRRATLTARREELKKVVRGLYRTQKWLHASPPEALADAVQSFFPAVPTPLLRAAIARYRALGIWGRNPILPHAGYERLRAGLISARFVQQAASFEQAVDNTLAEEIVRDDPPALEG